MPVVSSRPVLVYECTSVGVASPLATKVTLKNSISVDVISILSVAFEETGMDVLNVSSIIPPFPANSSFTRHCHVEFPLLTKAAKH